MRCFILATVSADGFIARDSRHLSNWSSNTDKGTFEVLTRQAGVVVMGSKTFNTIGRALTDRRNIVYTRHPEGIGTPGIETTSEKPADLLARLESEGHSQVAVCGGTEIYTLFMQAGVVDELYLVTEPFLMGVGVTLFNASIDQPIELFETTVRRGKSVVNHFITAGLKMHLGAKAKKPEPSP